MRSTVLAFIADVHHANHRAMGGAVVAGHNTRACATRRAMREAAQRLRANVAIAPGVDNVGVLCVLGDLFDTTRPEPQLIASAAAALTDDGGDGQASHDTLVLLGNHDMVSTAYGDNALAPLHFMAGTTVVEKPRRLCYPGVELICVPFQPGIASTWLPAALEEACAPQSAAAANGHPEPSRRDLRPARVVRVLLLHLGLRDVHTPPWLRGAADSIDVDALYALCAQHNIDAVYAGNWHSRREWAFPREPAVSMVQVGALVPTGFDNAGLTGYGGVEFLVVTTDDSGDNAETVATAREEVPGPRFVTVRSEKEARRAVEDAGTNTLYLRWVVDTPDQLESASQKMRAAIEAEAVFDGRVDLADTAAKAAGAQAAAAARDATTFAQALAQFVEAMPLDPGVDRAEVLTLARTYLNVG